MAIAALRVLASDAGPSPAAPAAGSGGGGGGPGGTDIDATDGPRRSPAQSDSAARDFDPVAIEPSLRPNLDFWISIYTKYTTRQGVIHDGKYINHIYEVIDLDSGESSRAARLKWQRILLSVHRKQARPDTMTPDERKVYDLFKDVDEPDKFLNAANRKRVHFQLGQKDRFLDGLRSSGRYLPRMEEIFQREGVPVALTRLPFVESGFNLKAFSKVGASGIWQFMRSTGKLYLTVDDAVDERNDPIRAAEAAAKLLKSNYQSLGNWPLAVTAYNHGRKAMMRAVRRMGSQDLGNLVSFYHGRTFGFASGNFFCELMAAVEAERHADRYFGKVTRLPPLRYAEVTLPDFIRLRDLERFLNLDSRSIRALNPALTEAVYDGTLLIPAGYRFRLPLPEGKEDRERVVKGFLAGYSQIPGIYKLRAQNPPRYPAQSYSRHRHRKLRPRD